MTDINFLYWLRGLLESKKKELLSMEDIKLIEQHLALITSKEMQATVFIEGYLYGLTMTEYICPSLGVYTTLNNIVSGVIQELAYDKKEEKLTVRRALVSRGSSLSRGFSGGQLYC